MTHPFALQAQTLREKLQTATDLAEPWSYFQDSLASLPGFLDAGVQEDNPELWGVVGGAVAQVLGKPQARIGHRFLFHLPELHLWHGGTSVAGLPLAVFYFDDLDKGCVGLLRSLTTFETSLMRFSLVRVPAGATPTRGVGRA